MTREFFCRSTFHIVFDNRPGIIDYRLKEQMAIIMKSCKTINRQKRKGREDSSTYRNALSAGKTAVWKHDWLTLLKESIKDENFKNELELEFREIIK